MNMIRSLNYKIVDNKVFIILLFDISRLTYCAELRARSKFCVFGQQNDLVL
jgi:hypothetical protein